MTFLDSIGLSTFEQRCPNCKEIAHRKNLKLVEHFSQCPSCKTMLHLQPTMQHKPNKLLIEFIVSAVEKVNPQGAPVSRLSDVQRAA